MKFYEIYLKHFFYFIIYYKNVYFHLISRELLEGNLKSVMRLILALAAHYKPQSVKHHDTSTDSVPETSIHTNPNQNVSGTRESEDNISR